MKNLLSTLTLALGLASVGPLHAQDDKKWAVDMSLYGVAAGMSGQATVKGFNSDVDVGFDKVLEHLKFGAMGSAKVSYDRLSLSTDVIYMNLGASKGTVSANVEQWLVQPMLGYRVSRYWEVTAGTRYNNLSMNLQGTGPLGNFRTGSGTVDWWDPVVGSRISVPLCKKFSFDVMGDVGGAGVGSYLTWQALPVINWQFTKWASLQVGYRWLYTDYVQGSGSSRFRYDILTQGPQVGFTFHF